MRRAFVSEVLAGQQAPEDALQAAADAGGPPVT